VASDAGPNSRILGSETAAALTSPLVGLIAPARRAASAHDLPSRGSFCAVSDPLVQVIYLGRPRHGGNVVVHLHSLAPETAEVELSFPGLIVRRLLAGNFLEREQQELPFANGAGRLTISPGALVTVRVDLDQ
jgi:hypothetical protein